MSFRPPLPRPRPAKKAPAKKKAGPVLTAKTAPKPPAKPCK
jgi:hypothetical protein